MALVLPLALFLGGASAQVIAAVKKDVSHPT